MLFNLIINFEKYKWNKDYGVYVSNLGHFKDRYKRLIPVKVNLNGYLSVKTEKGYKSAHRLVMYTWKPIPNAENTTVDHLNHNKRDNCLKNLEWVDNTENQKRAGEDIVNISENPLDIENVSLKNNTKKYRILDKNKKTLRKNLSLEETYNYLYNYSNSHLNSFKNRNDVIKKISSISKTKRMGELYIRRYNN